MSESRSSPIQTREALDHLTELGFGVVDPSGVWWNKHIARSDPGQMVLATSTKPIFGLVKHHPTKPAEEAEYD